MKHTKFVLSVKRLSITVHCAYSANKTISAFISIQHYTDRYSAKFAIFNKKSADQLWERFEMLLREDSAKALILQKYILSSTRKALNEKLYQTISDLTTNR